MAREPGAQLLEHLQVGAREIEKQRALAELRGLQRQPRRFGETQRGLLQQRKHAAALAAAAQRAQLLIQLRLQIDDARFAREDLLEARLVLGLQRGDLALQAQRLETVGDHAQPEGDRGQGSRQPPGPPQAVEILAL